MISNRTDHVDPTLVYTYFDPMMQDAYHIGTFGLFSSNTASYGNSNFTLPIHSNNNTAEASGYLEVPSMPGQELAHNCVSAYASLPQVTVINTGDFTCTHPSCDKKFTRRPNMLRHAKVHDPNAQRFDCPFAGCPRKGRHGFPRSDKLLAHQRAHRRAIQKAQGRAPHHG